MITHYFFYYDESVDSLVGRIDTNRLRVSLEDSINVENDVFLIHALIRINTNNGIYRKCELKQYVWNMLSDRCIVDKEFPFCRKLEDYKRGFDNLFDYCWQQKYSIHKDGRDAKPVKRIIYNKMPFKRKLLDNNIALVILLIMFLFLAYMIDVWAIENQSWKWGGERIETHPIFATCAALLTGIFIMCLGRPKDVIKLTYSPIISCIIFILFSLVMIFDNRMIVDSEWQMFEWPDSNLALLKIQLIKRNLYLGLACLLLIPLLRLNIQRLDDLSR